jgi:hypothetical protein
MIRILSLADYILQFWPISPGIPRPSPPYTTYPNLGFNQLTFRWESPFSFKCTAKESSQNFAICMKNYESMLFHHQSINESISRIQSSLGIDLGHRLHLASWSPSKKINSLEMSKICSTISAYRLLDVVALLDGVDPAPSVERRFIDVSHSTFRVCVSILKTLCSLKLLAGHR